MTLYQLKAYSQGVSRQQHQMALLHLFVARAAQADEAGYKQAVKVLGGE